MEWRFIEQCFAFAFGLILSLIVLGNFFFDTEKQILVGLLQFSSIIFVFATLLLKLSETKQKERNEQYSQIADLISLFRKTVLGLSDDFVNCIRAELSDKNHNFITVSLNPPSLDVVVKNQHKTSKMQAEYLMKNTETIMKCQALANALEEFAVRVSLLDAQQDDRLQVVRSAYVRAVEDIAMFILFQRELISGNDIFSYTLSLYKKWEPDIDKTDPTERLAEFLSEK